MTGCGGSTCPAQAGERLTGKVVGAVAGGAVLLLLAFIVIAGGGTVASADPSAGGCAVTVGGGQPGPAGPGTTTGNQKDANLNANQMSVARTIVATGKGMNVAERGIAIALGVAMQESTLNPNAVSGRSVGLFQQQDNYYKDINRTDPADASRGFFRMLLQRVPNYAEPSSGTFADVGQTVQASGAGAIKYAEWERWATALASQLFSGTPAGGGPGGGPQVNCKVGGGSGPIKILLNGLSITAPVESGLKGVWTFPNARAATAAAAALSYLGTTYAWGGGDAAGPTKGIRDGGVADAHGDYNKVGFDCSGLMEYAWAQAGVTLPGVARAQQQYGIHNAWSAAQPGDLLFYGFPAHHVTMYLGKIDGKDYMVEAPQSGDVVKVSPVRTGGDFQQLIVRPAPA